jgi:hypothetical protein
MNKTQDSLSWVFISRQVRQLAGSSCYNQQRNEEIDLYSSCLLYIVI